MWPKPSQNIFGSYSWVFTELRETECQPRPSQNIFGSYSWVFTELRETECKYEFMPQLSMLIQAMRKRVT